LLPKGSVFLIDRMPCKLSAFFNLSFEERLQRQRIVKLLSARIIRDDWSFDTNRAARFLYCLRTFDFKDGDSPEYAEILDWISDHGQSLDWILGGELDPDSMICMLAHYSPGRRQTRGLQGA
jgi:hypothetical protein